MRQIVPPVIRRCEATWTTRFQIWTWGAQRGAPFMTRDVVAALKMPRETVSVHLRRMFAVGSLSRERMKCPGYLYAYRSIADCPPQCGMDSSTPANRLKRHLRVGIGDVVVRVHLTCADVCVLVSADFLQRAREFECAPLVRFLP